MDLFPATLAYLARYAASTEHLRQVLRRKVQRRAARSDAPPPDSTAMEAAINDAVSRAAGLGLLNDTELAASLARQYRRRGESMVKIRSRLLAKGLQTADIETALLPLDDDERAAAETYAKRKRLGPFRLSPGKPDQPKRDLASMCRAGFSLTIARQVIERREGSGDFDPE
tara:strand:- start:3429 stop:3941 length:513 start_codon:yes stop_codon:yes gene_type:complete